MELVLYLVPRPASTRTGRVPALDHEVRDDAVEYRATLTMKIKVVARDGTTLWEDKNVSLLDEYRVSADIFESESAKRQATERIAHELMADVHDRIFDGFDVKN